MSLPKTFISASVSKLEMEPETLPRSAFKCEICLNSATIDSFSVADPKTRSIIPILSPRDNVRFIIKQCKSDDIVGCISFSAELFLSLKGSVVEHWITLFDTDDDDEYDGDLTEDDDESPRILLSFAVDTAANLRSLKTALLKEEEISDDKRSTLDNSTRAKSDPQHESDQLPVFTCEDCTEATTLETEEKEVYNQKRQPARDQSIVQVSIPNYDTQRSLERLADLSGCLQDASSELCPANGNNTPTELPFDKDPFEQVVEPTELAQCKETSVVKDSASSFILPSRDSSHHQRQQDLKPGSSPQRNSTTQGHSHCHNSPQVSSLCNNTPKRRTERRLSDESTHSSQLAPEEKPCALEEDTKTQVQLSRMSEPKIAKNASLLQQDQKSLHAVPVNVESDRRHASRSIYSPYNVNAFYIDKSELS